MRLKRFFPGRETLAALIALLSVSSAGIYFSPRQQGAQPGQHFQIAVPCHLHEAPCTAVAGDARIELEITPRPIPLMQPLNVAVRLTGIAARKVDIDFSGVDMNMGANRHPLTQSAPGVYQGKAAIPLCVTGAMKWRATVLIDDGRLSAAYEFISGHP